MSHALRHLPGDAPIVEIGSFHGLSTGVLSHLKQVHAVKNRLFTCDRWASWIRRKRIEGSDALTNEEFSEFGRASPPSSGTPTAPENQGFAAFSSSSAKSRQWLR